MGNRLAELPRRVLWEEMLKRFHTVEMSGHVVRLPNNFIGRIQTESVRLHPYG
jgi:hypothetical protein